MLQIIFYEIFIDTIIYVFFFLIKKKKKKTKIDIATIKDASNHF